MSTNLTKREIVLDIYKKTNFPQKQIVETVQLTLDIIQKALADLSTGRTTLVIAHRLQTIRNADKICVVEQGQVLEEGTHDALLARHGRYAALHQLHFAAEAE